MIRKLILAVTILTLAATPAFARGGGGGFHGGGGGFHGGGGGFHGGGMGGFHDGGGTSFHGGTGAEFHSGGGTGFRDRGFHDGGFHGGAFRGRHERFDHFHRFGFSGGFGFAGPDFEVSPFFWDPFWFPAPYPVYSYAPPLVIQPETELSMQQLPSPATPTYWYYCVDAKAYYPYTQQCPGGWLKVVPTPAG